MQRAALRREHVRVAACLLGVALAGRDGRARVLARRLAVQTLRVRGRTEPVGLIEDDGPVCCGCGGVAGGRRVAID